MPPYSPGDPRAAARRAVRLAVGLVLLGSAAVAGGRGSAPAEELARARAFLDDGSGAEAVRRLAELVAAYPNDPNPRLALGEALLFLDRATEARAELERVVALDPDAARAHFQLGVALSALGETAASLERFAEVISLANEARLRNLARQNRAMALQEQRRWDESAAELEAVLADGGDRHVWGDLARIFLRASRPQDAERALDRGLEAGFRSAPHWAVLGDRYAEEALLDDALRAYGRARSIEPDHPESERGLAEVLHRLGRDSEARSHLARYLTLRPGAPDGERLRERIGVSGS